MTAGQLLRHVRQRHGLTQGQLAARARTSQAQVSRIERDLVSPSVATLVTLLDLMGEKLLLDAEYDDWGHDASLIRDNLRYSVDDRLARGAAFSRFAEELRGAATR